MAEWGNIPRSVVFLLNSGHAKYSHQDQTLATRG